VNRKGCFVAVALVAALLGALAVFGWSWWGRSTVEADTAFVVPSGSSLTSVAQKLETEGLIHSADRFLMQARVLGSGDPIKAGEFLLPAGSSPATILDTFQHGEVIRRFVTIPEGLPSIMVHERLMAEPLLTGTIPVPAEGSVLPESYDFERGESRAAVLARMQQAMTDTVAELWPKRAPGIVVATPREAVILASIVEKETGVASERRMVAGLYSNRPRGRSPIPGAPRSRRCSTRRRPRRCTWSPTARAGTCSPARSRSTTPTSPGGSPSGARAEKCEPRIRRLTKGNRRPKCAASPAPSRGGMPMGRSSSAG
jgi:UPF0755 protein